MTDSLPAPVAIVLAAGKGTRMRSERPKVLFPVLGRPIVQRVVDAARSAGCQDVVAVVGYGETQVRAALSGVAFARQEGLQGTGQAVAAARDAADFAGRTVLVLPGDVPLIQGETLRRLLVRHQEADATITVLSMRPADATGYGRLVRDADGQVERIVEHRDTSPTERAIGEVNTAIYAMSGDFLFGEHAAVDALTTDNQQNEYLLTDVVAIARTRGLRVDGQVLDDPREVAGINDRAQLAALEQGLRRDIAQRWMRSGVSMDDPDSVRIEEGVELGQDVVLGAGVELRGRCTVADGVVIGKGAQLVDVTIGEGAVLEPYVLAASVDFAPKARVLPFSVLRGLNEKRPLESTSADRVQVGVGARVGPFSHLRQASDVGPGAHVGNFVELKKTTLAEGAKANHLTYLGDASIGARSNIGAGVITCNYDGFAKHRTIVGSDVFVGTDSHLVAPVRLGNGAYVATGTTVTKDVPTDALAIGRARQENKKGYGPKLKNQLERRAARKKAQESAARPAAAAPEKTTETAPDDAPTEPAGGSGSS
jgi:bifunctional UDP-N-acetylglucosamine pyrophosphorylase / glucosamine-1-phosphate N-acetyltransferase